MLFRSTSPKEARFVKVAVCYGLLVATIRSFHFVIHNIRVIIPEWILQLIAVSQKLTVKSISSILNSYAILLQFGL